MDMYLKDMGEGEEYLHARHAVEHVAVGSVSDVDQGLNTMCDEITIELVCRVEDGLAGHGATGAVGLGIDRVPVGDMQNVKF